ncbi:hypothetical protein ACFL6M_03625 [Candidatus Eisenbacteria bacterium]|uniref:Uncharacterized protein n=1 Tax=Eiseniibacteriota bacterium TaxID=2212470 RepID=A0ABV6YK18_UNCEI
MRIRRVIIFIVIAGLAALTTTCDRSENVRDEGKQAQSQPSWGSVASQLDSLQRIQQALRDSLATRAQRQRSRKVGSR